ncbi:LysR family transcriptional regulator [Marinobacterium sp. D7]|uniref:LysR family transcriptional regulator n=1 Tax=Marinobacterium ramblicola TaxID=2849041 RepID=UPI001C2D7751|nr:LysR family transcriptional regulator [Marinobacterium ramblicola]MBV1787423.1 LysR family transcriptional regulator [Marinobacterium ramblicola]
MISLRQVQVYLAVAEQGSTTAAGEAIALSQSATSAALAELEQRLGVELFDRVGRKLVLNGNGRLFYPEARQLLTQAEQMTGLFSDRGSRLQLGASTTIGNYLLPKLLTQLPTGLAGAQVSIANTGDIAEQVARCELELGLVEGSVQHPDLSVKQWRRDEMLIVAAAGSGWMKTEMRDDELAAAPWIMRERGSGTRSVVEQQLLAGLDRVNIAYELGSSEAIRSALLAGLGISCLSRQVVARELDSGELVELAPTRRISRWFYIVQHRQRRQTPALAQFIERCLSQADNLSG